MWIFNKKSFTLHSIVVNTMENSLLSYIVLVLLFCLLRHACRASEFFFF